MEMDIDELILFDDPQLVGDTFIFEPSKAEAGLGRLLVAAETEEAKGVGRELLDTIVHALQGEYFRDPVRGVLASFESALHQANLVLHDVTEQGVRDWMDSLHVAVAVLANTTLHISTAGNGVVLLARKSRITPLSSGLSHSPVTDPLRTFAQVASGTVRARDVVFVATANFERSFRVEDLTRFVVDHSAQTVTTRLRQLYEDQRLTAPLAVLVAAVQPENVAMIDHSPTPGLKREALPASHHLQPRQPLTISSSLLKRMILLSGRLLVWLGKKIKGVVWPAVKTGSKKSGKVIAQASRSAREQWKVKGPMVVKPKLSAMRLSVGGLRAGIKRLPTSSKIFAVVAILLAVSLTVSVVLLQKKRAADIQFQLGSELLHEARTKKEAAETALIYDNRDQARELIAEAEQLSVRVSDTGLYEEQVAELSGDIIKINDRLDRVVRFSDETWQELGDFSAVVGPGSGPGRMFYLNGELYVYDAASNTIAALSRDGGEPRVVNKNTQGIGFFSGGSAHEADKTLLLLTDSPGLALYDTKTEVLQKQEIGWPSVEPDIRSVAVFGSRVYAYDRAANNIFGYSKTLRGFSGGNAWITDDDFPRDTIREIGVDGYIYTLHEDGSIYKLLKGVPVDFSLEKVEPPISSSAHLLINEDLRHLYVFDPVARRVVIFDTLGSLSRQIYLGDESEAKDIAVDPDESTLYVLEGTRVRAVSLLE